MGLGKAAGPLTSGRLCGRGSRERWPLFPAGAAPDRVAVGVPPPLLLEGLLPAGFVRRQDHLPDLLGGLACTGPSILSGSQRQIGDAGDRGDEVDAR